MNYLNNPTYKAIIDTLSAKSNGELMSLYTELDNKTFTSEIATFKTIICQILESRISEDEFNNFLDNLYLEVA